MNDRTPDEVNRSIAELTGWVKVVAWKCDRCYNDRIYLDTPGSAWPRAHWRSPLGYMEDGSASCFYDPPDYYHDLNALRDGPEAKLRKAGLVLDVHTMSMTASAVWYQIDGEGKHRYLHRAEHTGTEAHARALAAEAALKAMRDA